MINKRLVALARDAGIQAHDHIQSFLRDARAVKHAYSQAMMLIEMAIAARKYLQSLLAASNACAKPTARKLDGVDSFVGKLHDRSILCYKTTGLETDTPQSGSCESCRGMHVGDTYTIRNSQGQVQSIWYWSAENESAKVENTGDPLASENTYYILSNPKADASGEIVLNVRDDGFATWIKPETAKGYKRKKDKEVRKDRSLP